MINHSPRRLLPYEYDKYHHHLTRLDNDSKRLRFGITVSNEFIRTFCESVKNAPDEHVLFGIEDRHLNLIAVAHVALDEQANDIELAFSVLKRHQRQGLGNALFKRVLQWCRVNNKLKGRIICLPSNLAIKHLCTKWGLEVVTDAVDSHVDISLPQADFNTHVSEIQDAGTAVINYYANRIIRPFVIV